MCGRSFLAIKKMYTSLGRGFRGVKGTFLNTYSYFIDDRMAENVEFLGGVSNKNGEPSEPHDVC